MSELETEKPEDLGSQMSFLDHLDELRRRLVNSVIIIVIAFIVCFYFSGQIFAFLSVPIIRALNESQRRDVPLKGPTGDEKVLPLNSLKIGDRGRYVFNQSTTLGAGVVQPGASVSSVVGTDPDGNRVLYSDEPIFTNDSVIPKGVVLPADLTSDKTGVIGLGEKLIVTTAQESFTLYVTVSLYSAIALSIPLLLLQVWGFISPALYRHERAYVTPFVLLSSVSFVGGAAFAYYILFRPGRGFSASSAGY
jgi:Sec-independent protein secretion pathway component TatC